jgi:hypothetical protein
LCFGRLLEEELRRPGDKERPVKQITPREEEEGETDPYPRWDHRSQWYQSTASDIEYVSPDPYEE